MFFSESAPAASGASVNAPNEQTGSTYTFALADGSRSVIFNRASAQAVTIPANSSVAFPVGTRIPCLRGGAGLPTISPDTGVTLNKPTGIRPNRPMKARLSLTGNKTGLTWPYNISWDAADVDTDGFWSSGAATRLTIPAGKGIVGVHLTASAAFEILNTAGTVVLSVIKGGSALQGSSALAVRNGTTGFSNNDTLAFASSIVTADSEYFEARGNVSMSGQDQILTATQTWFGIEVTEINPVGCIAYQHGMVFLEKIDTDVWTIYGPGLG